MITIPRLPRILFFFAALASLIVAFPARALAACAAPAAVEGTIEYFSAGEHVFKYCDGTNWIGWGDGGSALPAGADTQVQFNSAGAFGASDDFIWDGTTLTIASPSDATRILNMGTISGGGAISTGIGWPMFLYPAGAGTVGLYANQGMSLGGGYFTTTPPNDGLIVEGNVGIGTPSPSSLLHIKKATDNYAETLKVEGDGEPALTLDSSSAQSWFNPLFLTTRSRGSRAAKTIVSSGDSLFELDVQGYDGSTNRDAAYIKVSVDGTPGASDMPGRIEFHTQADGGGGFLEGSTPELVIKNNGNIGIGTGTPSEKLHVANSGAESNLRLETASSASVFDPSRVEIERARGTLAAKSIVASGDEIGGLYFGAFDGSSYTGGGNIIAMVDGTPGVNDMPMRFDFYTSPDGSAAGVRRMTIKNDGNIGIGDFTSDTVDSTLHIQSGDIRLDGGAVNQAGCIRFDDTTDKMQFSHDCSTFTDMAGAGGGTPAGANTQIQFNSGGSFGASSSFVWDDTNWRLGIGTTAPNRKLHIAADTEDGIQITHANASSSSNPFMSIQRSRGTVAAPTIVGNDDELFELIVSGYDGSAYRSAALLAFNVDGTPGANDMPTRLDINLQSDGAGSWLGDSASTPELTIKSDGNIGMGTASPWASLQVERSGGGDTALALYNYSTADNNLLYFGHSRGTSGTPAAVQDGDNIAYIASGAYTGAQWDDGAAIAFNVDGAVGANDLPTSISFLTTPDGSDTPAVRMVIDNFGTVGIGTADPASVYGWVDGAINIVGDNGATARSDIALFSMSSATTGSKADLDLLRARGTPSAPTIIAANDSVGTVRWNGYDGNSWEGVAEIIVKVPSGTTPANGDVASEMYFKTRPAAGGASLNRMIINKDGDVGIGTTSPSELLHVAGRIRFDTLGTSSATTVCRNTTAGNVLAACTSSIKYKEDVKDLPYGLKEVMQMRPVTFKWKDRSEYDFGFIAEEVEAINPFFATYDKDGVIEGVKYMQMPALLVNAVKEQQGEIETLRTRIESLEAALRARDAPPPTP